MDNIFTRSLKVYKKKYVDYFNHSMKYISAMIRDNKNATVPGSMKKGEFYFIIYDSKKINKSSKMEQNVPMLLIDYKENIDSRVLYILNMNFIPLNIKEAIFANLFNNYDPGSVDYASIYTFLLRYGAEYAIREIRVELLEKIYHIDLNESIYLITANTKALTGVDEKKLSDIWVAKLKSDSLDSRLGELKDKADYEKIIEELKQTFKELDKYLNS
jgi:hypothetical protein